MGYSPGTGGLSSIGDIPDVDITSPTEGQTLKYNPTTQKWENGDVAGSAEDITYDNTNSTLSSTNVQGAIDELDSRPTTLSASLDANATTLSFTDTAIGDNTRFDVYTSVYGVNPTDMAQSSTTLTLTFSSSHDAATIQVHCWNT